MYPAAQYRTALGQAGPPRLPRVGFYEYCPGQLSFLPVPVVLLFFRTCLLEMEDVNFQVASG